MCPPHSREQEDMNSIEQSSRHLALPGDWECSKANAYSTWGKPTLIAQGIQDSRACNPRRSAKRYSTCVCCGEGGLWPFPSCKVLRYLVCHDKDRIHARRTLTGMAGRGPGGGHAGSGGWEFGGCAALAVCCFSSALWQIAGTPTCPWHSSVSRRVPHSKLRLPCASATPGLLSFLPPIKQQ